MIAATTSDAEDVSLPGLDPYEHVSRDRYNYWFGDAQDIARGNLKSEIVRRADVEKLSSGPYVELFSRQSAPGWTAWGNEISKFDDKE